MLDAQPAPASKQRSNALNQPSWAHHCEHDDGGDGLGGLGHHCEAAQQLRGAVRVGACSAARATNTHGTGPSSDKPAEEYGCKLCTPTKPPLWPLVSLPVSLLTRPMDCKEVAGGKGSAEVGVEPKAALVWVDSAENHHCHHCQYGAKAMPPVLATGLHLSSPAPPAWPAARRHTAPGRPRRCAAGRPSSTPPRFGSAQGQGAGALVTGQASAALQPSAMLLTRSGRPSGTQAEPAEPAEQGEPCQALASSPRAAGSPWAGRMPASQSRTRTAGTAGGQAKVQGWVRGGHS